MMCEYGVEEQIGLRKNSFRILTISPSPGTLVSSVARAGGVQVDHMRCTGSKRGNDSQFKHLCSSLGSAPSQVRML